MMMKKKKKKRRMRMKKKAMHKCVAVLQTLSTNKCCFYDEDKLRLSVCVDCYCDTSIVTNTVLYQQHVMWFARVFDVVCWIVTDLSFVLSFIYGLVCL